MSKAELTRKEFFQLAEPITRLFEAQGLDKLKAGMIAANIVEAQTKAIQAQKAEWEREARIDELKNLDNEGGEYELITYISGEQEYVTNRIAELSNE